MGCLFGEERDCGDDALEFVLCNIILVIFLDQNLSTLIADRGPFHDRANLSVIACQEMLRFTAGIYQSPEGPPPNGPAPPP